MNTVNAYRWRTREEMAQGAHDCQECFNVDIQDIIEFGVENRVVRRADGYIRTFSKTYYLITVDCQKLYLHDYRFKTLKELMKGKYNTRKNTIEEYKKTRWGMEPRRAIDWTYTVKR